MRKPNGELTRRGFLIASGSLLSAPPSWSARSHAPSLVLNDHSNLSPTAVDSVQAPRSTEQLQVMIRNSLSRQICIGGGRFSMGGQTLVANATHINMRELRQVLSLDVPNKRVRVQAGITWRELQEIIDPHNLSVKVMQSYANFTVGGSLSVNCHGRYVGAGAVASTVRQCVLITAKGERLSLSRDENISLFRATIGGYGGLGVIAEVELDLADNTRINRSVLDVPLGDYSSFYANTIARDPSVVLHNADLRSPDFSAPRTVTWRATDAPLTDAARLTPRGLNYFLERHAVWAVSELPAAAHLRNGIERLDSQSGSRVVWRNREASLDTASLEPNTRAISTYLLQEYFIPVEQFLPFVQKMGALLRRAQVNALNVSIRHAPADATSLLAWASQEVFCFVLYYKQRVSKQAQVDAEKWTQAMIDIVLTHGGRYYLPYRRHATREQFRAAYPEYKAFKALRREVDPQGTFTNALLKMYLSD